MSTLYTSSSGGNVTFTTDITETAERPFLVRTFEAEVTVGDGRTVDVRLVPFGEVARVADPPNYVAYDEEWLPGCFDHQVNAANRVHANYEHERGVTNIVGHGISLRAEADGYHASFRIHDTNAGNTTLELLRGDALPGVSLEAVPVKNITSARGVVQRAKANLRGMAFCRQGAFAGAQVLAVRSAVEFDEAELPVDMDPELVARCRRLGMKLPQRYEAQPEPTDTPVDTGTSEDGTRHHIPSSSEEHDEYITE